MKVAKLHLENFRIHGDSVLAFGDSSFVVIRGKNFAGKSTIAQALSMCLTPSTVGLDAQGRGYITKIKRGESKAIITADLQTKHHLVQRTVTLSTNSTGRTQRTVCLSDPTWKTTRFDEELEKQRAALTVVLNTDAFLRMDEKEQKNLLAGLALPAHYDFDPTIVAEVDRVLGRTVINFAGEPFAVINQAYKKLFDERQIVNRQVREFVMPEELAAPAGVDSASLQNQLTGLRVERRDRQQARDKAVAEANKEVVARTQAKAKVQSAIDADQRRKNAIMDRLLKDGQLAYLRQVANGKDELERLIGEREQAVFMRDACVAQIEALEKMPWGAKECPTCEQPVTPEHVKALSAKLKDALREFKSALGLIDQKVNALGDVAGAIEHIARHEEALKELDAFEERAPEVERQVEKQPEPTLFDFTPYDRSIEECDLEIERLSGLLRPVIVAEERRKEIEIKQTQFADLRERAHILDRLVKYFDKDGIKARLIGKYIGGFTHKLNEVMDAWGYSCTLSIEPYTFDVKNARGDIIPVRELSGAERVMFSLAFQCAVSMTANIGVVVIDEVAMFLPELRPVMNKRLYEMIREGYLDQVILLVADSSDQMPAASLPGSAFFFVDNGDVTPLNRSPRKEPDNERRTQRQQPGVA